MSENQNSAMLQPVTEALPSVGIGYNDHEYEKAIHVLVERVAPANEVVQTPKPTKRPISDGGKPDGLMYVPEVQDTFSCGVCGKLYNRLLPFLNHRIQHADAERGLSCELCTSSSIYYQPFRLREHYKKVHSVDVAEGSTQRSCRSVYRRKPPGGNGPSIVPPPKKQKTQRGKKGKGKQKVESTVPLPTDPLLEALPEDDENEPSTAVVDQANSIEIPENETYPNAVLTAATSAPVEPSKGGQAAGNANIYQIERVGPDGNIHFDKISVQVAQEEVTRAVEPTQASVVQSPPDTALTDTSVSEAPAEAEPQSGATDKELDFYFLLVTSLVRGSSFMYGKQSFKCLHCDYKTFWKQAFTKHMKDNHSDVLSQHEFIEMRSTEKNRDQKLMKMSEFVEHQALSTCKRREKTIRVKEKVKDKHGNYPCTNCSKVFNRWSYLRKHMRIHVPTRNFLCIQCGKAFKTNNSLQQHLKIHQKEAFTCNVCGFKSNINAAIHAHRQFHSQGSVLCDICGNAYMDKSTLTKHKRVHDPSRPFGCPYPDCTWRFKTEVMCNGHFRAHTSNAQFKCTLCGYEFRQKHHLRRHERQTHGIQHLKTRAPRSKMKEVEETQAVTNITLLHHPTLDPGQLAGMCTQGTQIPEAQVKAGEESEGVTNITVLHPALDPSHLPNVDESPTQILIPVSADMDGNPIPFEYKMSSLGSVNVSYQQVLPSSGGMHKVDGNTLYIKL